jgi:sterol desaturase/sphingolipid hydroxylase (fatty acid hydroxylase superfamily)
MLLEDLVLDLGTAAVAFFCFLLIFRPLELNFPARHGQPFLREGWSTDFCFFLGQYLVWIAVVMAVLTDLIPELHRLVPTAVRRAIGVQPFWLQFVEIVVLGDLIIYWAHRLQHRVDFLWRFHAVHHTSERLDWLAAHREHPLDTVYSALLMNLPAYMLGFSVASLGTFIAFRGLWAIFIHSNVRLELGPLGMLLGSPAFHHWHHDRDRPDVNFGNLSPLMDVLFGTHYDPGYEPETLGLREPAAKSYVGLLVNPLLPLSLQMEQAAESVRPELTDEQAAESC